MSHMPVLFPCVAGQTGQTDRTADLYGRLLKERIIFLGTQVDDASANLVCAQLLLLAAEDAAPGMSTSTSTRPADPSTPDWPSTTPCNCWLGDVATTCMGLAAPMGQFLLCAGTPGKRFALLPCPGS